MSHAWSLSRFESLSALEIRIYLYTKEAATANSGIFCTLPPPILSEFISPLCHFQQEKNHFLFKVRAPSLGVPHPSL